MEKCGTGGGGEKKEVEKKVKRSRGGGEEKQKEGKTKRENEKNDEEK